MTGQLNKKGRDDEGTENRRRDRPRDGRQPRHRASAHRSALARGVREIGTAGWRKDRGDALGLRGLSRTSTRPWDDKGRTIKDTRRKERRAMCPACIASTAVTVAGAGSAGGIL